MINNISLVLASMVVASNAQSSSSYYKKPSSSSYYKAPSSSSYYTKPASYSAYKAPSSSSYYTKPASYSAYKAPSSSSYSYYTKPATYSGSSYYTTPTNYYVAPTVSKGYYYPTSGNYYNSFYGQSYAYSAYGYQGGYYGSTSTTIGYNKACPYGCTVNGFCGTSQQCASASAVGAIIGAIVGLAIAICCCICCLMIFCKKQGVDSVEDLEPAQAISGETENPNHDNNAAPFEGSHVWEGQFFQNGMPAPLGCQINCNAGELSGNFVDMQGEYCITGDTDGETVRFRKEYPNMPMVCYEGRFVGNRDRIEGNYGFGPGQMTENFWLNLSR